MNNIISIRNLILQEKELNSNLSDKIHKLKKYLSEKIGKKITNQEAYELALEMYEFNFEIYSLVKEIKIISDEKNHKNDIVNSIFTQEIKFQN